jgi:ribosomal protein S18 acetylase RimI-like enzyme
VPLCRPSFVRPKLIEVRELVAGEGLTWRDLRLAALQESPGAFGSTYAQSSLRSDDEWHRTIDQSAADPDAASFVAEVDGRPMGLAFCRLDDSDPRSARLFSMWVEPTVRGRGVGRRLVEVALQWMRSRGALSVELEVAEGNLGAASLYAAMGFVDTGRRVPLREGSQELVALMSRSIA